MSIWESIVLGIIQGLTEFLPVSSSGHIELGQAILGTASLKEQEELLSVVLHAATALALPDTNHRNAPQASAKVPARMMKSPDMPPVSDLIRSKAFRYSPRTTIKAAATPTIMAIKASP